MEARPHYLRPDGDTVCVLHSAKKEKQKTSSGNLYVLRIELGGTCGCRACVHVSHTHIAIRGHLHCSSLSLSLTLSRLRLSFSLSLSFFFCMSCGGKTTLLVQPAGLNRWSVRARTSMYTVEAHCFPVCKTARACFFCMCVVSFSHSCSRSLSRVRAFTRSSWP